MDATQGALPAAGVLAEASAPGKIILLGEHAVVYGQPAIALPLAQVRATATITAGEPGNGCVLDLPDIDDRVPVSGLPTKRPLAHVTRLALAELGMEPAPDWQITVRSSIPVASGLGSGAATATAIVEALAQATGQALAPQRVSALVYESETLFHGTPSGIDNTVVAFRRPVWFVKGQPPEPFAIGHPFTVLVADTGIASPTSLTVGDVRRGWQADSARYEALFGAIGRLVRPARRAIEKGYPGTLGQLMDQNHRLLRALDVSSPDLDRLCQVARAGGALGAKLSGGGRGGNLIALVPASAAEAVRQELMAAGAVRVLLSRVGQEAPPDTGTTS